jgi:hypothetical protein
MEDHSTKENKLLLEVSAYLACKSFLALERAGKRSIPFLSHGLIVGETAVLIETDCGCRFGINHTIVNLDVLEIILMLSVRRLRMEGADERPAPLTIKGVADLARLVRELAARKVG